MIALALGTPLVAMLAMLVLARIEHSLDRLTGPAPPRVPLRPARVPGTVRLRRSGRLWVLDGHGADGNGAQGNGAQGNGAQGNGRASEHRQGVLVR